MGPFASIPVLCITRVQTLSSLLLQPIISSAVHHSSLVCRLCQVCCCSCSFPVLCITRVQTLSSLLLQPIIPDSCADSDKSAATADHSQCCASLVCRLCQVCCCSRSHPRLVCRLCQVCCCSRSFPVLCITRVQTLSSLLLQPIIPDHSCADSVKSAAATDHPRHL